MSVKLGDKVTSVSVNINFGARMSILCKRKKIEILGEMLTFSLSMHYYLMNLFLKNVSNFDKKKTSIA